MKKILLSSLLSILILSCTTNNTDNISINNESTTEISSTSSIDDIDISPSKNNQEKVSKLIKEILDNQEKNIIFKSKKLKETSLANKKANDSYNLFGAVNYYDDKGNLKLGANIKVNINSGNSVIKSTFTDENGKWSIALPKKDFNNKNLSIFFEFDNKYWNIGNESNKLYSWKIQDIQSLNSDIDTGVVSPIKDSENAKAAFIHDIYNRYLKMFKQENVDYDAWWKKVNTVWPGSGNFYSFGTVNLTDADHWDVNGHEIGHAVTAMGTNSQMGGGQHKIDECYTNALAWSEGFATFLSGVVNLEKNDTDAKFEFLVPRRAPIRIENVPADVCKQISNEWRVSSAMWDLYDTNLDGKDSVAISFKTIFTSLGNKNKRVGSVQDAFNYIKENVDANTKQQIDKAFEQNF